MRKLRLLLMLLLSLAPFPFLRAQESADKEAVQITTYYPSPYGAYQQLSSEIFQFRAADGPPSRVSGKEKKGMLYFDEDDGLRYHDGSEWKSLAGQLSSYSDLPSGATAGNVVLSNVSTGPYYSLHWYSDGSCTANLPGKCIVTGQFVDSNGQTRDKYNSGCEDGFKLVLTGKTTDSTNCRWYVCMKK